MVLTAAHAELRSAPLCSEEKTPPAHSGHLSQRPGVKPKQTRGREGGTYFDVQIIEQEDERRGKKARQSAKASLPFAVHRLETHFFFKT